MGSGQKFEDATKKQQFLCEIPPTASVFGTTKQWYTSNLFDIIYLYINI